MLQAFPAGNYCLPALLRVVEVVETTAVQTAAIECKRAPQLLLNPDFVERHVKTPERLLMLVLHELHHVILGHTRLFPRATEVDNLVFDAVINATLVQQFPDPEFTSMFTEFYDENSLLECFLRPASGWKPNGRPAIPTALGQAKKTEQVWDLIDVHAALYSSCGIDYEGLRRVLAPLLSGKGTGSSTPSVPPLLGDHREEFDGASSAPAQIKQSLALTSVLGEALAQWPNPSQGLRNNMYEIFARRVRVAPPIPTHREILRRAIRQVANEKAAGRIRRTPVSTTQWASTPVPRAARRASVLRCLGAEPLLYDSTLDVVRHRDAGARVHLYLDVSGSVSNLIPSLYAAALDCRDSVHPIIHTFSTALADKSLKQLAQGQVSTTGGTCLSCVVAHMEKHRIRHALLITDGYVPGLSNHERRVLEKVRLAVVLTPGASTRATLEPHANHWEVLP